MTTDAEAFVDEVAEFGRVMAEEAGDMEEDKLHRPEAELRG
jgi:hypothetical protein